MSETIESRVVQYPDLQTPAFAAVNPLKKVPALIRADGETVFESAVILNYLEDKYADAGPSMKPDTPEGRQLMELMIRIHDLYIASPNCTAPGFSHSQGAMYLSTAWHGTDRGMDLPTRAAKIGEIWKHLSWLEANMSSDGPYLLPGTSPTLADFTWFPTAVFMEFMLPMFGWPDVFDASKGSATPFPKLAKWYDGLKSSDSGVTGALAFSSVHETVWGYWVSMKAEGQFEPIVAELQSEEASGLKFAYGHAQMVELNYQGTVYSVSTVLPLLTSSTTKVHCTHHTLYTALTIHYTLHSPYTIHCTHHTLYTALTIHYTLHSPYTIHCTRHTLYTAYQGAALIHALTL
jgi:glutathione S-transferase